MTKSVTHIFLLACFATLATSIGCSTATDKPAESASEIAERPEATDHSEESEAAPDEPVVLADPSQTDPAVGENLPVPGDFCDPDNIRSVVGAGSDDIRYCFERELQENLDLKGRIDMFWIIKLDGTVSAVEVKNTEMNDEKVEECISQVIKQMEFDEPNGGLCQINYPFVFHGLDR